MLCSFHNEEHKKKKLKYEENIEINEKRIHGKDINNKTGYIKADQLYYFDKDKIEYKVLARVDDELLVELVQLILKLNNEGKLKNIITNVNE